MDPGDRSFSLQNSPRCKLFRYDSPGIFIQGRGVTIGCLPMTDPGIEEIHHLAENAGIGGRKTVYVHLFPTRLTDDFLNGLPPDHEHLDFWRELQPIYAAFKTEREIPYVEIGEDGAYRVR